MTSYDKLYLFMTIYNQLSEVMTDDDQLRQLKTIYKEL